MEIAEARERYAALKEKIDYHNHLYLTWMRRSWMIMRTMR